MPGGSKRIFNSRAASAKDQVQGQPGLKRVGGGEEAVNTVAMQSVLTTAHSRSSKDSGCESQASVKKYFQAGLTLQEEGAVSQFLF